MVRVMSTANVQQLPQRITVVTRTIDAVDRAHARAATVLHGVRNEVRSTLERGIERAEHLATTAFARARQGVQHADGVSADLVNRAQGVVGQAIDKTRKVREKRLHAPS
jgi:hypothetical protein